MKTEEFQRDFIKLIIYECRAFETLVEDDKVNTNAIISLPKVCKHFLDKLLQRYCEF